MKLVSKEIKQTVYTLEITGDELLALRIVFGKQNEGDFRQACEESMHKDAKELWRRCGYRIFKEVYNFLALTVGLREEGDMKSRELRDERK